MSIHKFIFGFFQLYKHKSNLLYNNSNTASVTDLEFNNKFSKKILVDHIICKHIGISGQDHKGRTNFDIWDI